MERNPCLLRRKWNKIFLRHTAMKMKKLSPDTDCSNQVKDWITYGKNTDWGVEWMMEKDCYYYRRAQKSCKHLTKAGINEDQNNLVWVK